MRGFDAIRGYEGKYAVVVCLWLKPFLKKNWGLSLNAGMMLLVMSEVMRPLVRSEWEYLMKATSGERIGKDILALESRGFIERYAVSVDDLKSAHNKSGGFLKKSVVRKIMSYRFEITDAGKSICETLRYNIRLRVEDFTGEALKDMYVYRQK